MKISIFTVVCLACMLSTTAGAEIYKWKDANGVVRYSDIPPPANVQVESVNGKKKSVQDTQKSAIPTEEAESSAVAKSKASDETKRKEKLKEAEALVKKENCDKAKSNMEALQQPGAYKLDEKGERVEFDEASIAKEREITKKDIDRYCK
jgi:hypothetical protein